MLHLHFYAIVFMEGSEEEDKKRKIRNYWNRSRKRSLCKLFNRGKSKKYGTGAICDIDPDRKVMYAEKYPSIPFYDHYIDMLPFDEELFLNELNKRIEVEKSQINSRGEHK